MNPIPVRVWSAAHDSTRLPKSQRDAERISDELYWQSTDTSNPVYHAFAQDMLIWMEENHIPVLGDQAELRDDLLNVSVNKSLCLSFEHFPRDKKIIYEQFLLLARKHELVVYDTNYPTAVFLPNKSSIPIDAQEIVSSMARRERLSQHQQRKVTDTPIRFDQVPEWLKIQMDQTFAPFGFSPCVIQLDSDGAIMGRVWKKSPAGLIIIASLVYERYGEMRIWGTAEVYLKDLFKFKAMIKKKMSRTCPIAQNMRILRFLLKTLRKNLTPYNYFSQRPQRYIKDILMLSRIPSLFTIMHIHMHLRTPREHSTAVFSCVAI